MNERLTALYRASRPKEALASQDEFKSANSLLGSDVEKFAELIVKECGKVIVNGGYRNPALGEKHPLTPPEIAKMIKEHFGVEE